MSNFSHKAPLSTRRLTMNAVFIALYVVLDFTSVYISNEIKLSFAAFPLLVASMLFGTLDGVFVAGIGEFLYQTLQYGIGPTTLMWMVPPILHAAIAGIYAQRHGRDLNTRQIASVVLVSGIVAALVTTVVIHLDAKFWGYPSGLTAVMMVFRGVNTLIMCVIYTLIVPKTLQLLRGVFRSRVA